MSILYNTQYYVIGRKESSKIVIKNNEDGKPPQTKRPRGKRMGGGGGCPFYKPTALGNFSDLALVWWHDDYVHCILCGNEYIVYEYYEY